MTTTAIEEQIRERVSKGAALLDEHTPGWAARINEAELNLGECEHCILGQVYGHYIKGSSALGLRQTENQEDFGFELPCQAGWWDVEYEDLAAAWLHQIRLRLSAPVPGPYEVASSLEMVGAWNCPRECVDVL